MHAMSTRMNWWGRSRVLDSGSSKSRLLLCTSFIFVLKGEEGDKEEEEEEEEEEEGVVVEGEEVEEEEEQEDRGQHTRSMTAREVTKPMSCMPQTG
jgi:hypothetical protein